MWARTAQQSDAETLCQIGIMAINLRPQRHHRTQRRVQIAGGGEVNCRQFHRRIFGKYQKLRALPCRIIDPLGDFGLPFRKALRLANGILGGSDANRRSHRSRIQNCI